MTSRDGVVMNVGVSAFSNSCGKTIFAAVEKGELTMHRYFFNVVNNKSAMVMPKHNVGLTLSYSFLE